MPDDSARDDADIIRAAYAERVSEAFKVFAENLATGQSEQACKDRFKRALLLVRKTRDLALLASTEDIVVEPRMPGREVGGEGEATAAGSLSAEDQAMIEHALDGTTGVAKPARLR